MDAPGFCSSLFKRLQAGARAAVHVRCMLYDDPWLVRFKIIRQKKTPQTHRKKHKLESQQQGGKLKPHTGAAHVHRDVHMAAVKRSQEIGTDSYNPADEY